METTKKVKSENWHKSLKQCQSGKHKLRTNKFGVTWCVRCGLLSNTSNANPLTDEDRIEVICGGE